MLKRFVATQECVSGSVAHVKEPAASGPQLNAGPTSRRRKQWSTFAGLICSRKNIFIRN